jgi:hypothetical protein
MLYNRIKEQQVLFRSSHEGRGLKDMKKNGLALRDLTFPYNIFFTYSKLL